MSVAPSSPISATDEVIRRDGSFAERVSFETVYRGLARKGIKFTEDDKRQFEEITLSELKRHDGGSVITTDLGVMITNLAYLLLAFAQNIFGGSSGGDFLTHLSNTMDRTSEQGKLRMLEQASANIYDRMKLSGGNLAIAAELVTGMMQERSAAINMNESVFSQIRATIALPEGTVTSLNAQQPFTPNVPHQPNRPLTRN